MSSFLKQKFYQWAQDVSALANPILLVLVPFVFLGPTKIYGQLLWVLLINEVICSLIKIFYPKKRPNGQEFSNLAEKIDSGSFPSIHSSRITLTYLTLLIYTDFIAVKIALALAILLVMVSRVLLKKHYWIDVIGGMIIGLLLWYLLILR